MVYFKVAGLGLLSGNLSIKASYAVESEQRVSIKFIESTLVSTACVEGCRCSAGRVEGVQGVRCALNPIVAAPLCFVSWF